MKITAAMLFRRLRFLVPSNKAQIHNLFFALIALLGAASFSHAGIVSYTYDELGRLKSVTNDQGETAKYVYDELENLNV